MVYIPGVCGIWDERTFAEWSGGFVVVRGNSKRREVHWILGVWEHRRPI